jgi:hypothetical protein
MRRLGASLALAALCALASAPTANAAFGIHDFDVTFSDSTGAAQTLAGSHPYELRTAFKANLKTVGSKELPEEAIKDLEVFQLPGFIGDQSAVPKCETVDFLAKNGPGNARMCADSTAVGIIDTELSEGEGVGGFTSPVYNLEPPPGTAARLGFFAGPVPVTISITVNEAPPYNLIAHTRNISQVLEFFGADLRLWGVPADPVHDQDRGPCYIDATSCPAGVPPRPFLTMPRACEGPLRTEYELDSWQHPGTWVKGFSESHDDASPPNPQGMLGCGGLGFGPTTEAEPSTTSAESAAGLDFTIDVADEGLKDPDGRAKADIEAIRIALPAGLTANPSAAEGLGVCSLDQYQAESLALKGCPEASKLGTIEAETPLLEEHPLHGSLYLASQADNPFGSLLALYLVVRDPELGIFIKLPVKVETDPASGQIVTTVEGIPPFPLSHVVTNLRSGPRAPLITPPSCGTYTTLAELTPSSGAAPLISKSSFQIDSGVDGGPCPKGGTPPFEPGFQAGALNNNAGSFSPFYMRLTRRDGDQDLTKFSAALPPGMVAKLAGTSRCSEAGIAAARARSGVGQGREELASPSCPAGSQIGSVKAGAGVGALLTWVPGKVYLAGPYNGAPLSAVGIVPAVAGPFDVGVVVARFALRIDPRTAKVTVDGAASDPIPHILAGIPLKVRDIRAYVDKQDFTINPTDCEPFSVGATLWGGGADVFSPSDDSPLTRETPFQAANCASLGFKPILTLKLKGGAKRGDHPALTGTYRPRPGDANLSGLVLRLPRSAFLDQAHIRTICTRVQFAAKACPPGAIYGQATAYTPLLDQPLSGPVYLRSSDHNLPDFVADLHGLIDVEAVARIDSKNGGIRATFSEVPDAPLSKVTVQMQGQKKGLIVNSTDLCFAKHKAAAQFSGHNGKRYGAKPAVQARCGGKQSRKRGSRSAGSKR